MSKKVKDKRCFNCHEIKHVDQYLSDAERRCNDCIELIYGGFSFTTKTCCKCKIDQPITEFNQSKNTKTGLYPACRTCSKKDKKASRIRKPASPEKIKQYKDTFINKSGGDSSYGRRRILAKFGMSLADYNDLLEKQNNLCAICKEPETAIDNQTGSVKPLAIDHDHVTGEVRGLLCSKCNTGLGLFDDSIENLESAILYLKGYKND